MPRYRVIGALPEVLEYKTARYFLKQWEGMYGGWNWSVQKDQQRYSAVILLRAVTLDELEEQRRSGFDVPAGSAEEKVMQRLVRDGVAIEIGTPA